MRPLLAAIHCLLFSFAAAAPEVTAPAVDFSPIASLIEKTIAQGKVAGLSLLIIHGGESVFHEGFGFADLETQTPFEEDAPVVIASISKPLLGTAVFRLTEAGVLDPAVPVSQYLPEFGGIKLKSGEAASRAPTVRELLAHIGGTRADDDEGGRPWLADWTRGKTLAEVVAHYAREFPLLTEPGTRHAYSGVGTDIVARVAEVASQMPRNELLLKQVAIPLGMDETGYHSTGHAPEGMPTRYSTQKDGSLARSRDRRLGPPDIYNSSGGSVISTATDVAQWLSMIRDKGMHEGEAFLSEETVEAMLNRVAKSENTACGFFVRKMGDDGHPAVIGHTGSTGTSCWIDFENDIIGIMLTQTSGQNTKDLRPEVERLVTELLADSYQPFKANAPKRAPGIRPPE